MPCPIFMFCSLNKGFYCDIFYKKQEGDTILGVLVNVGAVVLGSLIGLLLKKGIPERISSAVMVGLGLCTLYIGYSGSLEGENILIVIFAMVLGAIVGTLIDIDGKLNSLAEKAEKKFSTGKEGSFAQGFMTGSLLFCVGAMAVVGSLNSGLRGDHQITYTKSLLDFFSSMMLAASLGIGVTASAVSVFVYQGLIVMLASFIEPFISGGTIIAEMTCAGSLLIVGLGLNLIGVAKIKVANYLPVIVFVPIVYKVYELISNLISNIM